MQKRRPTGLLSAFALVLAARIAAGDSGGGPIQVNPPTDCVTSLDQARVTGMISEYEAAFGPVSRPMAGQPPPPLTFYPMAGKLWRDVFTTNYVDLDATSFLRDWDCLQYTFNGHAGNDTAIRSFDEQAIGVPVYAAAAGKVIARHDGEPDMNTEFDGQPANFVIIDHGLGRQGWYFHLKQNSLAVNLGVTVARGQQIGMCGSSGNSSGPHLHFEIRDGDQPFEPYAGPCRAGPSGWVIQPLPVRSVYLHDFGITHESLSGLPGWPYRWPATGQLALSDPYARIWFYGTNLPPQSNWSVRFRRPDGTLLPPGSTQAFNNGSLWKWFSWWASYDVAEMHVTTGTWHVQVQINGTLMVEAPVEVVAKRTPGFNRPPQPISVGFVPVTPLAGDELMIQVTTSLLLDDFDYDVVRYQYVWEVDGDIVRSVTTAAQSDVLRGDLLTNEALVSCSVTPHDGQVEGPAKTTHTRVGNPPVPAVGPLGAAILAVLLLVAAGRILLRRDRHPAISDAEDG